MSDQLICPEFNFELFCYRVLAKEPKNPIEVIDMANQEAWYARRQHRTTTKEDNFRRGSQGRAYCEDLQRMVSVLMNGNFPSSTKPEFKAAIKPLALHLLKRYEIGQLRQLL